MAALPAAGPQGHAWTRGAGGARDGVVRAECGPGSLRPRLPFLAADQARGFARRQARLRISPSWRHTASAAGGATTEAGGATTEAGGALWGLALTAAPALAVLLASPAASWAAPLPVALSDVAHPAALLAQLPPHSLDPVLSLAALLSPLEWPATADFQNGLAESFLLVLFSEIGDKTFFIAALLAARRPAGEVFIGTFGALGVMTVISVLLGRVFHILDELLPVRFGDYTLPLDDVAAAVLLVYFGLQTLRDAAAMEESAEGGSEEEQEAAKAVAELQPLASLGALGSKKPGAATSDPQDGQKGAPEGGVSGPLGTNGRALSLPMLASVFALVFFAEWGDKSFFSTIALAAASSPFGVTAGSVMAHGLATIIAVLGGQLLSQYVSEKAVASVGGVLFLGFAAVTISQIIDKAVLSN